MARFTSYTRKNTPADSDVILIADSADSSENKTVLLGGLWSWLTNKFSSATIGALNTTSKTVVGAINEVSQVDANLNTAGKAADAGAVGDALALKANANAVYTKAQVDNLLPTIDDELDDNSTNPIQNKVVAEEISGLRADLDTQTSGLKQALLPFIEHLVGAFDDENGGEYTENLLAVLRAGTPEPVVNMVKSENIIGTSAQLFTDEGTTEQASLKTSGSSYYYLDAPAEEDCTYKVTIIITTDLNSFRYKAVYAYNGELISGKGTATPTAYNLTNTKEGGIISVADPNPDLTEDYVFETQISVKANRNPAIMFYRDYDSCIGSVTAQKVG